MRSILLIDDDEDDRGFFVEAVNFLDKNIQCWTASDGQNALDVLSYHLVVAPDLIFLDLNMPKMNGLEFLKTLKANPTFSNIPVIIYTTSSNPTDYNRTMEYGAVDYVIKPSDSKALYQKLIAVLNQHLIPSY